MKQTSCILYVVNGGTNMANRTKDLTAVIEKYNRIKKEKGRVPVVLDFSQEEKSLIKLRYGSFLQFCTSFGDKAPHGNVWIPDDIFITEIQELYHHLGYPPHSTQYKRATSAIRRFNTDWKGLLKIAGIPATFSPRSNVSKEEVAYKTKDLVHKSGSNYLPSWNQLKKEGIPVSSIYVYWDSMSDFRQDIGVLSRNDYIWISRKKQLYKATASLLGQLDPERITVPMLIEESQLTYKSVMHFVNQSGGIRQYLTDIKTEIKDKKNII